MYQARRVATLSTVLGALVTLGACADTGSGSACTRNVEGCPGNAFSCEQAQTCYTTAAACQASGECGGGGNGGTGGTGGTGGGGGSNSCTTNVEGCAADAFSCPQARFCYNSAAECADSGECGGANPSPNSCTTNVEGCAADAFSCPQARFCYNSAAECDASNECQ